MWKFVGRRALASIPVLLLASILIFLLVREFGADPARVRCGQTRDPQCVTRVREQLGLDRPLAVQYVDEMQGFVTGDWGTSQRSDQSVQTMIADALGETAQLAFWAVLLSAVNWYLRFDGGEAAVLPAGILISLLVVLILVYTGWQGGKLVFVGRVGVADDGTEPR